MLEHLPRRSLNKMRLLRLCRCILPVCPWIVKQAHSMQRRAIFMPYKDPEKKREADRKAKSRKESRRKNRETGERGKCCRCRCEGEGMDVHSLPGECARELERDFGRPSMFRGRRSPLHDRDVTPQESRKSHTGTFSCLSAVKRLTSKSGAFQRVLTGHVHRSVTTKRG